MIKRQKRAGTVSGRAGIGVIPCWYKLIAERFSGGGLHEQALYQVYLPFKIKTFNFVSYHQLQTYTAYIKQWKAILEAYVRYSSKFALTGNLPVTYR